MKAITLKKLIAEKLSTKTGKLASKYANIYELIKRGRYHGVYYTGSGRWSRISYAEHTNLCRALDLLKINYVVNNDAPRGGACGTFIELTSKGKAQVKELATELLAQEEAERKAWEVAREKRIQEEERRRKEREAHSKETYEYLTANKIKVPFDTELDRACFAENLCSRKMLGYMFHQLSIKMKQYNNDGFRRYVVEQAKAEQAEMAQN